MNVGELIEQLRGLDPRMKVVMPARDHAEHCEVAMVQLDTVAVIGGVVNVAHEDEADCRAVRLMGAAESL